METLPSFCMARRALKVDTFAMIATTQGSKASVAILGFYSVSNQIQLKFDLSFEDLYRREGLVRLDGKFVESVKASDLSLFNRLMEARSNPAELTHKQQSDLIVDLAPHVEDFIGNLFGISAAVRALQARHNALEPLFALKRKFIPTKGISGGAKEQA